MGILGGLDTPTQGNLYVAGVEITKMGENRLAETRNEYIGFVFQQFNLMPTLTAAENGDRVMDTLLQAQSELKTAVVIVTHDLRVAARSDRTLTMTDGRFAEPVTA